MIPDFMIQGGGFEYASSARSRPPNRSATRQATASGENRRGTLAMARTNDPHSATSQFFINTKDNDFLNRAKSPDSVGYAVFGRVIDGMDVVDRIRTQVTKTMPNGKENVPVNPIILESIRRIP